MTSNKKADWVALKEATPPNQAEVEVRTNSMDRYPRLARWDQAFKCFYDDNNEVIVGNEWRMLYGKTPITEERCILMKNIDDKPDGYIKDEMNSNEYFITFMSPSEDRMKYVYTYTNEESRSPW